MKRPILIAAAASILFASCSALSFLTPDQQEQHSELRATEDDPATPDVDEAAVANAEADKMEDDAATTRVSGIVDMASMFVPWAQNFKPGLMSLGLLAFPRVRQNGKKAVTKVVSGAVKLTKTGVPFEEGMSDITDGLRSAIALPGLVHTNGDPIEVGGGSAAAAEAKGQTARAERIRAFFAEEEARDPMTA